LKDEYAYNPTLAKKLLADAGYPTGFKTDIVADLAGDLDLLQICKGYFAAVGIDMDIRTMPTATWTAYVIGTHQHDQMAYRASGGLGISYDPFHMLLRYTQGYANNYLLVNDPVFSSFNTKAQSATTLDQVKQIVQDANLYVAQQHYAISLLCPNKFTACLPSFHGFTGQSFALSQSGGSSWATMAGFYNARFWIDQNNLK
jgi:ABC-type transport system substrate-binding protein